MKALAVLLVAALAARAAAAGPPPLLERLQAQLGAAAAAFARAPGAVLGKHWHRPDFCGNMECPPFKLDSDAGDGYERRTYSASTWAVTNVTGKYEIAYTKATTRLMAYFKGGNEDNAYIDLTTPTLAALHPSKEGEGTERDYSFSMWLPSEYQEEEGAPSAAVGVGKKHHKRKAPPEPSSDDVELKHFPETTVFVKAFGGFATESAIMDEYKRMKGVLERADEHFEDEFVFVATYDAPYKLMHRHNELHVVAKARPSAS